MHRLLIILLLLPTLSGCGKGMTLFECNVIEETVIKSKPIYNMVVFVEDWPEEERYMLQEELKAQLRVYGVTSKFYYDLNPSALVDTIHDSTFISNLIQTEKADALLFIKQLVNTYRVGELKGTEISNGKLTYDTTSTPEYTPDIEDIHNNTVPVKVIIPYLSIDTHLYILDSTKTKGQLIWSGESTTKHASNDEKEIKSYISALMDKWYEAYIIPPIRNTHGGTLAPEQVNE